MRACGSASNACELRAGKPWRAAADSSLVPAGVLTGATHISPERTLPVLVRLDDSGGDDGNGSSSSGGSSRRGEVGKLIAGSGPIVDYLAGSVGGGGGGSGGRSDGLVSLSATEAADMEAYTALVEQKLSVTATATTTPAQPTTPTAVPGQAATVPYPYPVFTR
jgi:hypothetical protein